MNGNNIGPQILATVSFDALAIYRPKQGFKYSVYGQSAGHEENDRFNVQTLTIPAMAAGPVLDRFSVKHPAGSNTMVVS